MESQIKNIGVRPTFAKFIFVAITWTIVLSEPIYPRYVQYTNYESQESDTIIHRSDLFRTPHEGRNYYSNDITQNENAIEHYPVSPSPRAAYGPVDIIAIHALELITPDPVKTYFNRSFTVMRNHLKDPVPKKKRRPISYLKPYQKKKSKIRYRPDDHLDLDDEDDDESDEDEDDDEYEEEESDDDYRYLLDTEDELNPHFEDDIGPSFGEEIHPSREDRFLRWSNLFYRNAWQNWPGHYNNFDRHYYSQYRPMRIHPIHGAPGWKPGY